jgi:predicted dehydrogenase
VIRSFGTSVRDVGFCLVGCGRVARNHLEALTGGRRPARLIAVADVLLERARARGEAYGVPWYIDHDELLARHPEVDVVDVATPTGHHARHVIDIARHGRHIVVEKPMALRVEDCRAMIEACARQGRRLFVVKQNRFNPAIVAARQALEAGRFGRLVLGSVRLRWRRDQAYYDADDWHGTWELDGGVMAQQASHHLDLLQWFMGPVESVQCQTATRLLRIEVEDTAAAILRFRTGALGLFEATVAARPEDLEASFSILGERGSVVIAGRAVNRITTWRFEDVLPGDDEMIARHSGDVPDVYGHGHEPYLAHVVQALVDGRPGLVEGAEGERNVAILAALYESAAWNGKLLRPGCRIKHSRLGRPRPDATAVGRAHALRGAAGEAHA